MQMQKHRTIQSHDVCVLSPGHLERSIHCHGQKCGVEGLLVLVRACVAWLILGEGWPGLSTSTPTSTLMHLIAEEPDAGYSRRDIVRYIQIRP